MPITSKSAAKAKSIIRAHESWANLAGLFQFSDLDEILEHLDEHLYYSISNTDRDTITIAEIKEILFVHRLLKLGLKAAERLVREMSV